MLLVSRVAVAQVETKLLPTLDIGSEQFGLAVSAVEDRIVVGAYLDDAGGLHNAGAVYVYDFDGTTWQETAKITPSDHKSADLFGSSVLLASDHLFVLSMGNSFVYNQAIADAQVYLHDKVTDLDGSCFEPEFGYWRK